MKWCIIMSRLENRKSDIFSIWVNFWIFSGLGLPPNALSKALWNKKMNTLIGSVSKTEITIWNEQIHPCPLLLRIILALQISQKYDGRLLATEHGNRLATLHFKSYQLRVQFPWDVLRHQLSRSCWKLHLKSRVVTPLCVFWSYDMR